MEDSLNNNEKVDIYKLVIERIKENSEYTCLLLKNFYYVLLYKGKAKEADTTVFYRSLSEDLIPDVFPEYHKLLEEQYSKDICDRSKIISDWLMSLGLSEAVTKALRLELLETGMKIAASGIKIK